MFRSVDQEMRYIVQHKLPIHKDLPRYRLALAIKGRCGWIVVGLGLVYPEQLIHGHREVRLVVHKQLFHTDFDVMVHGREELIALQ